MQRGMLLLWVSVVLAFGLDSVVACKEVDRSPTKIIIFCEGVEWWKIQHLFVPRIISTSCPSKVGCTFPVVFNLWCFHWHPVQLGSL